MFDLDTIVTFAIIAALVFCVVGPALVWTAQIIAALFRPTHTLAGRSARRRR